MRRSRGLGALRSESWKAVRYDLTSAAGWVRWLTSDPENPIPNDVAAAIDVRAACRAAWQDLDLQDCGDKRRRIVIVARLSLAGGLLVRSAPAGPDPPDVAHLESGGRSVLPGASLAGVLRGRALRIARLVREHRDDADRWIEGLFGPRLEGATTPKPRELHASRLRVTESTLEGGKRLRQTRIRIDRFTQGVVPAALFDEEPEHGSSIEVRLELRNPRPGEAGLLFLVLKDLLSGDLPAGGTSSVGRGVLHGTATARLEDGTAVELDPDAPAPEDLEVINAAIEEFAACPAIGGAS